MTRLREVLKHRGIKQTWLGEQTGLGQSWINKVVSGKSIPNVYDAQKIARALDVRVEVLWPLEEIESRE